MNCSPPVAFYALAEILPTAAACGVSFLAGGAFVWWRMTAPRRTW